MFSTSSPLTFARPGLWQRVRHHARHMLTTRHFHGTTNPVHSGPSAALTGQGRVYIVGAGPGDADLLTVKAVKVIQHADVVLFDALVDSSVLALIPRHVKREYVGKRCAKHSASQQYICGRLVSLAGAGFTVVRLKGGDPAIFGRTCEETRALEQADIPFAIVPGITAASGASAYTGISLTERNSAQAVRLMTAHFKEKDKECDWPALAAALNSETLVMYMGLSRLSSICTRLAAAGVPPELPVAVVESACCPEQTLYTGTLNTIARQIEQASIHGPALLIFGQVVNLRQAVNVSLLDTAVITKRAPVAQL